MMDTDKHWYVAYVKSCRERVVAASLGALGYQYYLPVQRVVRRWSDRRKIVERLVLPRMIFIRCAEKDRIRPLDEIDALYRYITVSGPYTPAVVRDVEMETFIRMVEHGGRDVTMTGDALAPGDNVRVVSGPLTGLECELISVKGRRCLAVRLGMLGTATMDLATDDVQKIEKK